MTQDQIRARLAALIDAPAADPDLIAAAIMAEFDVTPRPDLGLDLS